MDVVIQYVVSVVCAAILCSIVCAFQPKRPSCNLVKLICGTFLAFTFLKPIPELELSDITQPLLTELEDGKEVSEAGSRLAKDAMSTIIKERTETYILDKAQTLGISVQVEVSISNDAVPAPTGVIIRGAVSPYDRKQLEEYIRQELGISQEDQRWIG